MRVLFVDDEAIIREGLQTLIEWDQVGFDELMEAGDALEALDIIAQSPPDLIITDIFMPEMSGIEFAKKVRSDHPAIRFIILTGYEKFEYAKEAVEIGIAKYMVKPIFPEELLETVEAVAREIEMEKHESSWQEEANKRLKEYEPIIVEKFWEDLITGTLVKPQEIRERAAMIHLDLDRSPIFCAAVKLNMRQVVDRYGQNFAGLINYAVRNIAEEVLAGKWAHFVESDPSLLHGVFTREVQPWEFQKLIEAVRDTLQIDICVGIGNAYDTLASVSVSANEAEEAVHVLVMMEHYGVIHYRDVPNWKKNHVHYPYKQEREIIDSLRYKEQLEANLMLPFTRAIEAQQATLPMAKLLFVQLLGSVYRIADEYKIARELTSFYENSRQLNELETLRDIRDFFEALFERIIQLKNKQHASYVDLLVDQAKEVIAERYSDPSLTVGDIAKQLSITPNYLSRIFHEKTGNTCVEHLTSVRLDEAKKLFVHTSMKSYEIAGKVGYQNAHYFSVLFKKYTGLSPSDYRKQFGESNHDQV